MSPRSWPYWLSLALLPFQADGQAAVATCAELAVAIATVTVTQIDISADLRTSACMAEWPTPQATISRDLTITGLLAESQKAAPALYMDPAFSAYFLVSGTVQFVNLRVFVLPSSGPKPAQPGPLALSPVASGTVAFRNSTLLIVDRSSAAPLSHSSAATLPGAELAGSPELGAPVQGKRPPGVPRLGLYAVDAAWTYADVTGAAAPPGSEAARWLFSSAYYAPATRYAGGTLASSAQAVEQALRAGVDRIFLEDDINISTVVDQNAGSWASMVPIVLARDLELSGEDGTEFHWHWAAGLILVPPEVTLTITGDMTMVHTKQPTRGGLPFAICNKAILLDGGTLHYQGTTLHYRNETDVALFAHAGDPAAVALLADSEPTIRQSASKGLWHASGRQLLEAIGRLPQGPVLALSGGVWTLDWTQQVALWDEVTYGSLGKAQYSNQGTYMFEGVKLIPAPAVNPCRDSDFPGINVDDQDQLRGALADRELHRIFVRSNITLIPETWPQPNNNETGIIVDRYVEVIGCPSDDYTITIDCAFMDQNTYIMSTGFLHLVTLSFTNIGSTSRRGHNEILIKWLSVENNGTIDFEFSTFEATKDAPFLNFKSSYWNVEPTLLPELDRALVELEEEPPISLIMKWRLIKKEWAFYSAGAISEDFGTWNFFQSAVLQSLDSSAASGSSATLAIGLGVGLGLLLLCCLVLLGGALLARRRRRQRAAAEELAALSFSKARGMQGPQGSLDADLDSSASAMTAGKSNGLAPASHEDKHRQRQQAHWDSIKLGEVIGSGGFAQVYKGWWRGSVVAVKVVLLPPNAQQRSNQMMVMETAISAAMSHPNVIQTFTYAVRRAGPAGETRPPPCERDSQSASRSSDATGSLHLSAVGSVPLEVRIVQEYAHMGTLRQAIDRGLLTADRNPESDQDFGLVLNTAMDLCSGLVHLHAEQVLHCDLKASNVLLIESSSSPKGYVAKLADFGMAQNVSIGDTHISNMFAGTLSHMAPECLVSGQVMYASDIYSLAIIMWELVTGDSIKPGCPPSLLAFMVAARGLRPIIPETVPPVYADLLRDMWAGDHKLRLTAAEVSNRVAEMIAAFAAGTLGPCILKDTAPANSTVNTELTDDCTEIVLVHSSSRRTNAGASSLAAVSEAAEESEQAREHVAPPTTIAPATAGSGSSAAEPDASLESHIGDGLASESCASSSHAAPMPKVAGPLSEPPELAQPAAVPHADPSLGSDSSSAMATPSTPEVAASDPALRQSQPSLDSDWHRAADKALDRQAPLAAGRAGESGPQGLVFKSTDDTWDTFMLNNSTMRHGLSAGDIIEPQRPVVQRFPSSLQSAALRPASRLPTALEDTATTTRGDGL